MAKAILHPYPRQAGVPHSAAVPRLLGPTFLTPDCGYSIVEGLLYSHVVEDCWLPPDPLLVDLDTDYRPLVRNIRRCRRLLRRELRATISPRRKRQIRDQRSSLEYALFVFAPVAELRSAGVDRGEG